MVPQTLTAPTETAQATPQTQHCFCTYCWPGFQPGRTVVALCGTRRPDAEGQYGVRPERPCAVCLDLESAPCPVCGY